MRRKWFTALLFVFAAATMVLSYDNVLSDPAPVIPIAEQAACKVKNCQERHGMTRMDRSPLGQTVEFTWQNGTVTVHCSRPYLLFGERTCAP